MKTPKYKILVVGLGNPLRADDGLGLKAIEILKEESWTSEVLFLKIGTSPINYLPQIKEAQNIIVIDAIQGGKKTGSIYQLTLDNLNHQSTEYVNAHSYSLPQVITLAKEISNLPQKVLFYGLEPEDLSFNNHLSPSIKKNLPQLIKKIRKAIDYLIKQSPNY